MKHRKKGEKPLNKTVMPLKSGLQGNITIPGDKSISHRAVLFASLAEGETKITGFLRGEDCLSTISCMKKLGVNITENDDEIIVNGKGLHGFTEPNEILNVGNSGTTIRLLSGVLSGQPFSSVLVGDDSIAKRPMGRVTGPLKMMDAKIDGRNVAEFTPLHIRGGQLKGIHYLSPVASAQVKSAILLAGLYAKGETKITEPHKSRDHTERMLESFGVRVEATTDSAAIHGGQALTATDIHVPGDISSAAFMLVAGAVVPGSEITLRNVGMNPTRTGIIDVLQAMGADLTIHNERYLGGEPSTDLTIRYSSLTGITISGELIPRLIDEIPAIAVLASQAEGTTIIRDAEELKVKETNRIDTVVHQLAQIGVSIEATEDGMVIHGKSDIHGGTVQSFHDHRIGMSMVLCGLISTDAVIVKDTEAIAVSYPSFFEDLQRLSGDK
ncbi:3-phosphoshikimate 1-carboxyvinyltransferase [Salipaludibacillus keqinensis]|uniref:3-phosphoshikimate 1-carboxyvinyltransferase n=1 Tax=Salipaludibacillus keqinensis TaxID=2045207 RepID=A0A323THB1_9BACI|nr:3-phosphoshikimate 1-carboxyvinyltransferase [Salipaludibacillus keqinensis]PYZ94522.1 3-phosphoshikimate 1-carboxyvinyltransferase [Salipaludibacillus keqinensis]